jgi:uncharacterized protein
LVRTHYPLESRGAPPLSLSGNALIILNFCSFPSAPDLSTSSRGTHGATHRGHVVSGPTLLTKPTLTALLISDGKPGHYRQAEGILGAVRRLGAVETVRWEARRGFLMPARTLQQLVNIGVSPEAILRIGYGARASDLPSANLVVSAGGETLAANAAAAKLLGAANVFVGSLRRLAPEHIRIALIKPEAPATVPNQLPSLPPSPIDVPSKGEPMAYGRSKPPRRVGVLIGGDSGEMTYRDAEWAKLGAVLSAAHATHGISWLATTSRRSGGFVTELLAAMARGPTSGLVQFIDFRAAGPGTVAEIFSKAEAILCTDDSTAMVSEAVGACLPVVAVRPQATALLPSEEQFRQYLARQGWYRALPLAELTPETFLKALEGISPRTTSQLDELAAALRERLPELFADR